MKKASFLCLILLLLSAVWLYAGAEDAEFTFEQTEIELVMGSKSSSSVTLKPVASGFRLPSSSSAFTWSVQKSSVVSVSAKGRVTAKGNGTSKVWCSVTVGDYTYTAEAVVTVTVPVTRLRASTDEMLVMVGESRQAKFLFTPSDATDQSLSYESSDESVATVDADGYVTGLTAGVTTITARTLDGSDKTSSMKARVITLTTETTDITLPLAGGLRVRVDYVGDVEKFQNNIRYTVKSSCFKVTDEFDDTGIVLTLVPSKIGTGTITLTDNKASKTRVVLNVTVAETITDSVTPVVTGASLSGEAVKLVSVQVQNRALDALTSYGLRYAFFDAEGNQIFSGAFGQSDYEEELREMEYQAAVAGGETGTANDRVPSAYEEAVSFRVAVSSFTTQGGVTCLVPENLLRWFDSESGAIPLPADEAGGAVTLSEEDSEKAGEVTLGITTVTLLSGFAEHYGYSHSGRWITEVEEGSVADRCGLRVGDLIYDADGVTWADDPYVLQHARVKMATTLPCVFRVERDGRNVELVMKK